MWQWHLWMRLLTSPRCSQVSFSLVFNFSCSFESDTLIALLRGRKEALWYSTSATFRLTNYTGPKAPFLQPWVILPRNHTHHPFHPWAPVLERRKRDLWSKACCSIQPFSKCFVSLAIFTCTWVICVERSSSWWTPGPSCGPGWAQPPQGRSESWGTSWRQPWCCWGTQCFLSFPLFRWSLRQSPGFS